MSEGVSLIRCTAEQGRGYRVGARWVRVREGEARGFEIRDRARAQRRVASSRKFIYNIL